MFHLKFEVLRYYINDIDVKYIMYVLHDKDRCVISLVIGLSTSIVHIFLHDLCKDAYVYIQRRFFLPNWQP